LVVRGSAHLRTLEDMSIDATAHRIGDADDAGNPHGAVNGADAVNAPGAVNANNTGSAVYGDYELHLRFDPKRMDAALTLHEPASGPLEHLLHVPGLGALAATATLRGPRAAERLDLSVDAGPLHGRAQGSLNLSDLSADLDFTLQSPAMNPRPDLKWQRAELHGRWHGSIKAPTADGHFEVVQLRVPGGVELAKLNADVTANSGNATLNAVLEGLKLPGLKPQLLQDAPVKVTASMHLDEITRPLDLQASHRLFALGAHVDTASMGAGKYNATAELHLLDLTPLAALAGQKLQGSALIKAQLRGEPAASHVMLQASAALSGGREFWSGAVGNRATLQLAGTVTDKAITLANMKFLGSALSLTAAGSASRPAPGSRTDPALRLRWDLNISNLTTLSPEVAGALKASGTLTGPITALAGEARLTSTLAVGGAPSGVLSADVKVRGLPSAPSGTLLAQGSLDGAPLRVDIAVEREPAGTFRATVHQASWKSAHVDGGITVGNDIAQAQGQLRLQMGQLNDLRRLLGIDVHGSLAGTVVLQPDHGRTHGRLQFDARDLAVAGQPVGNVQLHGEGGSAAFGLKLDLQVPDFGGAAANVSMAGSLNLDAHTFGLASAVANYRGQDVRLLSPAQILFADGLSVDDLKLGAQKAVFELKGKISPVLDLRASLHEVQPPLVDVFVPGLLASGTIEARARLRGSLGAPLGRVRLSATGLAFADDAALGLPPLDLQATAQLKGNTADVDARLNAGTTSRLTVVGHAPLAADGALDMKITGNLDVGLINPMLEARGQHATGELNIDATVAGSVAAPQIGGNMKLTKGSVRDYGRGVSLSDIAAEVVGSDGALQIKSLTATAAPGTLSMSGTVGVLQAGVPVDLKITAKNAQPIVSKLVTANLDADLHVSGTARARLNVAGTVHLNRTLVGIPSSLPPNVAVLDVRRRGKAPSGAPGKQLVIGLDVSVHAPQEILVQGRGLDAEMGGKLHVRGTADSPQVSGSFDLLRGSFSLVGNKLSFTDGHVSFNGAGLKNRIDPTLDFTAQTTAADVTATLRISGYADAPQFAFTSSPALPQDEIMARLLFGVNAAQLSGLQVAQIGAALATLSGVGGDSGLNPLAKLQKSLGLDRLTVGAATTNTAAGTESSGASIEAGRYISKRVYIEAKQSTAGTSQLEADVDLTRHLKLQTRLGNGTASVQGTTPENDPGSSVGLTYQFEY
ncbi:MAG TPA: translocation/assembly module TamB domain-containing protein, partial [Steroidobacteraceae bacterium]